MTADQRRKDRSGGGSRAAIVATGILASRLAGLIRDRALAHFFGVGGYADVFRTALRGPNVLQNLLGEGTISAAFIPVYSRLIEQGRREDAGRLAGAVFALLLVLAAGLSLAGILFARPIVSVFAPGFLLDAATPGAVDRFALAVKAVRIIFPMTGVLVLSAWALGVLNSHRRFLVPYLAPVLWNVSIIAALVAASRGAWQPEQLLLAACWGALAGGALQFIVQLPFVAGVLRGFALSFSLRVGGVREVLRAVGPVIAGRGVYQLSAYLDLALASLLTAGAVAAMGWAATLYLLPVSLFGMSVAAAELPELSRHAGAGDDYLERLRRSLAQMAFAVVPTAVGYLAFGWLIVGAIYRSGRFTLADNILVALVLGGYTLGLVATTWSRLLQNAFFALGETVVPAKIAGLRVGVSALVAVPAMLLLDRHGLAELFGDLAAGSPLRLGALGLALGSAAGAWVELVALRRRLASRVGAHFLPLGRAVALVAVAALAALPAAGVWWLLAGRNVVLVAPAVVGLYALIFLAGCPALGLGSLGHWLGSVGRGKR